MRRNVFSAWTCGLLLSAIAPVLAVAQAPDTGNVVEASVCAVLEAPQKFDGKRVRIHAQAVAAFDAFHLQDKDCREDVAAIWLAYPEGTRGKAGAAATLTFQLSQDNPATPSPASARTPVKLMADKAFTDLDTFLSTAPKTKALCLGCRRYTVTATFTGRIDAVENPGVQRNAAGKLIGISGFGNLNRYKARLVLEQVSGVTPEEVDASALSSADPLDAKAGAGDGQAQAMQTAKMYPEGSVPNARLTAVYAAYGKPGESNGVVVGFGKSNEVSNATSEKSKFSSPDGLVCIATFDPDLKGPALSLAMAHLGAHLVDVRAVLSSGPQDPVFTFESNAWQVVLWEAIAFHQKSLVLPGGFLGWSAKWSKDEATPLINKGVNGTVNWVAIR